MQLKLIPPHLSASFDAHLSAERIRGSRDAFIVALVLFASAGILDIWMAPSVLFEIWALRAFVILLLSGLLWSTWFPFFIQRYVQLVMTIYLCMGISTVAMIYVSGINDLARHHYYIVIILEIMALYTWSYLSFKLTVAIGFFLVALYVAMAVGLHHMNNTQEWPVLLSNCFFLVSANIIGMYSNILRNSYMRESFLLQRNLLNDLELSKDEKIQSDFHSDHDHLTGLPNRKYLMRELKEALASAKQLNTKVTLLFIDLDGFKPINDELGHAIGDAVLKVIGQRLEGCARDSDIIARIGGDEFVVVLESGVHHQEEALRVANAILASFRQPIRQPHIKRTLSASIGIAFYPDHAADADELMIAADHQMYAAKRQGKSVVSIAPDQATSPQVLSS